MNSKRPLAPGFINALDNYLLRNRPVTWTSRTHLIIFYSLLFSLVLTLFCFVLPTDARGPGFSFEWTTITIIAALIGFICWCIYLLRFNVFKRFGKDKTGNGLMVFLLFFVNISFMILPCFIPSIIETVRANSAYKYQEVIDDANAINTKITQLYYDSIDHKWEESTYLVRDSIPYSAPVIHSNDTTYIQGQPVDDETGVSIDVITPDKEADGAKIYVIDTSELKRRLLLADSVVNVNDSTFRFYNCPEYTFLNENSITAYRFSLFGFTIEQQDSGLFKSLDIYKRIIVNFEPPDKIQTEKELQQLIKKYKRHGEINYDYNDIDDRYSIYNRIRGRYSISNVGSNISNILDKKFRYNDNNASRIRLWLYISLALTLLVFIFRHSTPRTYFLSILTCFILLILTIVFQSFAGWASNFFTPALIFYFAVFIALVIAGNYMKTRSVISGIALNIVTFFIALIPVLLLSVIYDYVPMTENFTDASGKPVYTHWSENRSLYFLIAEITGIVLLVVLIEPFFKRMFRNWYSKPEE